MHKQRRYSLTGYALNDFEVTVADLLSPYGALGSTCLRVCMCVCDSYILITSLRGRDGYTQDPGEKARSQKGLVPSPGVTARE